MIDVHVDSMAQLLARDAATFASLPLPLAQRIFLALPPDARGRASCVCRAWRDVLAEPALWTRLDMSGVRSWRPFLPVLHGAAGRARGRLQQVELSQERLSRELTMAVLQPVLTANAGSLRELRLYRVHESDYYVDAPTVQAVVAAAPLLQVLAAEEVTCKWELAPRMLRAEPPFAPLQMRRLLVVRFDDDDSVVSGLERLGPFAAALADATLQPAVQRLDMWCADTSQPALMGALVDAVLARRLRLHELSLTECAPPAAAPLARLLAEGSLAALELSQTGELLFDEAGAALVADALRTNTTLSKLILYEANLYDDTRAAESVLGALVKHPSVRVLLIVGEDTYEADCCAFGAALAALVAADAPALHVLNFSDNSLGDAGLAPIVEALALNCHLHELDLSCNGMSEAFARERLLPAVRANTMLRKFACGEYDSRGPAAAEAEELVRHRGLQG
jgi:hypothetical protein